MTNMNTAFSGESLLRAKLNTDGFVRTVAAEPTESEVKRRNKPTARVSDPPEVIAACLGCTLPASMCFGHRSCPRQRIKARDEKTPAEKQA